MKRHRKSFTESMNRCTGFHTKQNGRTRRVRALTTALGMALFWCLVSFSSAADWRTYPFKQAGSRISFPEDEGTHASDPTVRTEWWYTAFHLKDPKSGKQFAVMAAFFKPVFGVSLRLLTLADTTKKAWRTSSVTGSLSAREGRLDISHKNSFGIDRLHVMEDAGGVPIPFQYRLKSNGDGFSVDLRMTSVKPPLIAGKDGYVQIGESGTSFYYSFTRMETTGIITVGGTHMEVRGTGWMDHQWGPFKLSPIQALAKNTYEWFLIQLENGYDIRLCSLFDKKNRFVREGGFGGFYGKGPDNTALESRTYEIKRLAFRRAPSHRYYSYGWRVIERDLSLDLTVTPDIPDQFVPMPRSVSSNHSKYGFWEGACSVTGSMGGEPVTGKAFAELTHAYNAPIITFQSPPAGKMLKGMVAVDWTVWNHDDGNPMNYDLFLRSPRGKYSPIAKDLSASRYDWDTSRTSNGEGYALKVIGRSVDGTLKGRRHSQGFEIRN